MLSPDCSNVLDKNLAELLYQPFCSCIRRPARGTGFAIRIVYASGLHLKQEDCVLQLPPCVRHTMQADAQWVASPQ